MPRLLLGAGAALLAVVLAYATATRPTTTAHYVSLRKSPYTPPPWFFGVAWALMYGILGVVLALSVAAHAGDGVALIVLQFVLGWLWQRVFFRQERPRRALGLLVVMVITAMVTAARLHTPCGVRGVLLLPYIAWLCFATSLNAYIVRHN